MSEQVYECIRCDSRRINRVNQASFGAVAAAVTLLRQAAAAVCVPWVGVAPRAVSVTDKHYEQCRATAVEPKPSQQQQQQQQQQHSSSALNVCGITPLPQAHPPQWG